MSQGAPVPRDDDQRLRALSRLGVETTGAEPALDRLVRLAARMLRAPLACLSFVGRDRQWVKSAVGFEAGEVARSEAFCAHAILGEGVMEVEDAEADPRFATHPWVVGPPRVRFYAAAPLLVEPGRAVGTLCVMDTASRPPLEPDERDALLDLAAACVSTLRARQLAAEVSFARSEIERLTSHDPLTGTLNRRGLTERLQTALALARRTDSTVTVTLLDLVGFAALNDRHGHAVADEALQVVGRRLVEAVRDHDLVERTGGDEFAVVLQACDEASAVVVAARLLADLARPHAVAGVTLALPACAGVATFPRDAEDLTGLLRAADSALARAKAAGGGALAYVPEAEGGS